MVTNFEIQLAVAILIVEAVGLGLASWVWRERNAHRLLPAQGWDRASLAIHAADTLCGVALLVHRRPTDSEPSGGVERLPADRIVPAKTA